MSTRRLSRARGLLFATIFTFGGATWASADSLTLADVVVQLDAATLTASISAGLQAHSDTASDVLLDGLSVSLFEDGLPLDLTAGPVTLDDNPFFANVPPFLADGEILPPVLLFRLRSLTPGASYALSFFVFQDGVPLFAQELGFAGPEDPSSTPVPEPASISLVALGGAGLWRRVRRQGR